MSEPGLIELCEKIIALAKRAQETNDERYRRQLLAHINLLTAEFVVH